MQIEPEVSFQNVEHSAAVEQNIRERISQLEQFHPHLIACRVVVDAPHHDKNKGNLYEIRIDMSVPGDDVAVSRHTGINHAHEDIYVAIRDAFDAVRRRLEDYVRRSRGDTKRHEPLLHGRIVRLFGDGHGFIEDVEGNEYYFDDAGVVRPGGWLAVGAAVKFLGEAAGQGLQAKRVTAVR